MFSIQNEKLINDAPVYTKNQWGNFVENCWESNGKVLDFGNNILVSKKEAFDIIKIASEAYRHNGSFAELKLYVDKRQMVQNVTDHLPNKKDDDLATYIKRFDNLTKQADFMLYINKVEQYSFPLWYKVKVFLQGLFDEINLDDSQIEVELFMGRYTKTPGGIHKGGCSNFHFAIDGLKTFYVWPIALDVNEIKIKQECTAKEAYLDTKDLDWMKEYRTVLSANPGQAIFCPHDWWHVGIPKGLCIAVNVAIYPKGCAKTYFQSMIEHLIEKSSPVNVETMQTKELLQNYTSRVSKTLANPEWIDEISKQVLIQKTKGALSSAAPMRTDLPSDDMILRLRPHCTIEYFVDQTAEFIYVTNGHVFSSTNIEISRAVLLSLTESSSQSLSSIILETSSNDGEQEQARTIFNNLYQANALMLV